MFTGGLAARRGSGRAQWRRARLQQQFESFVNPLKIRPNAVNLIKAVCPIDQEQVVFVHVSPHRDDARPDGLDIFLGSCGHEVHRGEIEVEQPAELA